MRQNYCSVAFLINTLFQRDFSMRRRGKQPLRLSRKERSNGIAIVRRRRNSVNDKPLCVVYKSTRCKNFRDTSQSPLACLWKAFPPLAREARRADGMLRRSVHRGS